MKDEQQPFQHSRLQQREKRRKTNLILNSLIVIVLLLIVVVSIQIFFPDDQKTSTTEEPVENIASEKASERSNDAGKKEDDGKDADVVVEREREEKIADREEAEEKKDEKEQESEDKEKKDLEEGAIVTDGGNDPEVKKTIVNPDWESVGTVQTGEHHSVYGGVDWDEMVNAISYATGIEQNNMTIHFLGNNGPNKSVGTIEAKDTKQRYRVYIEWVDEQGWKPTLVEELKK